MSNYEVGAIASLRAMHSMPVEGPEGELHAHDYRIEVIASRGRLDEHAMVVDLDGLRAVMSDALGPLRDSDLGAIAPPEVEAVTVEVLSRWIHDAIADRLASLGAQSLHVRVWESDDAFAGYDADVVMPRPGAIGIDPD